MPDRDKLPRFDAATLPPPLQWEGRSIWRTDLKVIQTSTGTSWELLGPVSGDGIERLRRAAVAAMSNNAETNAVTTAATQTATGTLHASLTKVYSVITALSRFGWVGGAPVVNVSNSRIYLQVASVLPATNGNLTGALTGGTANDKQAWCGLVGVRTDSAKVSFGVNCPTGKLLRVIVDDGAGPRYINKTAVASATPGSKSYIEIDFAGVYAMRDIWVEIEQESSVYDVAILPSSDAQPATVRNKCTTLVTGDSYSEGSGSSSRGVSWGAIAGRLLGWSDVRLVAVGSTGYFANASGVRSKVRDQIPNWLSVNTDLTASAVDLVVIAAGLNDRSLVQASTYTASQVGAEAAACVQSVRQTFPTAVIIVVGPWGAAYGPGSTIIAIEAAVQSAVAALGDGNTIFLPCSTDVSPWIAGTGYVGATNSSGNSDRAIGSDGLHPSDAGHALLAARFAAAYRRAIGV